MTWTAEHDPSHFDSLSTVTGGNLVIQVGGMKATLDEIQSATRLIAAAPDLLAAVVALVDSFEKHRSKELWDAARVAIARATGAA